MLRSLSLDPGYIGVGELNPGCFRIEMIFLNERYLLKEKELGSIAGLARLPPLFQGSHKGELSKPPEVDDFDQRNGSSYHLRHLEDEDFHVFSRFV